MPQPEYLKNLFADLPARLSQEKVDTILAHKHLRIERILSRGQTSPAEGWYDQDEEEWVLVLQGEGELEFESGSSLRMKPGDHLLIPAHCRHRVSWTHPNQITLWLAVFFSGRGDDD